LTAHTGGPDGWFALARILIVAAVAYAAALLRSAARQSSRNIAFAAVLAGIVVAFERRLRETAPHAGARRIARRHRRPWRGSCIESGLFWANNGDQRVEFLHSFLLIRAAISRLVLGAKNGEWLEPARLVALFQATGPQRRYKILDTSVIIDGRIADVCDTGFIDGTLVVPQFVLKELQLVADSSDSLKRNRGRRGLDILQKIQKMAGLEVMISDPRLPGSREVDLKLIELARDAAGQDRHERFQSQQGRAAARRRRAERQRARQSVKPVVLPASDEGVHPQGRQGVQPGRRLPGRRHDGGGRQRAQDDQQDDRHRRHQRAADDGWQDDLRPVHRGRVAQAAAPASEARTFADCASGGAAAAPQSDRSMADSDFCRPHWIEIPPYHWWRTVFFLIPAITFTPSCLAPASICPACGISADISRIAAPGVVVADSQDHGRARDRGGLERVTPGTTYVFVSNHQSIYDTPVLFWSLPFQLRIIAKESLAKFPCSAGTCGAAAICSWIAVIPIRPASSAAGDRWFPRGCRC
jgi:hypothetical protein